MVERAMSKRPKLVRVPKRTKPLPGGKIRGQVAEARLVAIARAKQVDKLPHELMWDWARKGVMFYNNRRVELEPADRIACARGAASYYKAPYQSRPAPGEQPPVVRVELDEATVAALSAKSPEKLEVLRDVLKIIAAGGVDLEAMIDVTPARGGKADPGRYGRMLMESTETEGRA